MALLKKPDDLCHADLKLIANLFQYRFQERLDFPDLSGYLTNLLASPYIEMAKLKGMKKSHIILRHALPNAWAPIINVVAINLAYLIVGVVVVEVVFVYPGLGQLMVDSVQKRDIPVVQACSLIFAVTYILLNLTADILSIISNPRLLYPK